MHAKRIILLLVTCMYFSFMQAQTKVSEEIADENSQKLYLAKNWSGLLAYGKSTLKRVS